MDTHRPKQELIQKFLILAGLKKKQILRFVEQEICEILTANGMSKCHYHTNLS